MSGNVFLSRRAFDKGLSDTLTLKPLRDLARALVHHEQPERYTASPSKGQDIVVSRDEATGAWHVRKAS